MSLQQLLSWVTKLLFWQSPSVVEVPIATDLLLSVVVKITKCTLIQQGTFSETISYAVPTPNHGTSSVPMSNSPPMSLARHCYFLPCSLTRAGFFQGFEDTKFVSQGVQDSIIYGPSPGGWSPGEERISRIEFITKNLNRKVCCSVMSKCWGCLLTKFAGQRTV